MFIGRPTTHSNNLFTIRQECWLSPLDVSQLTKDLQEFSRILSLFLCRFDCYPVSINYTVTKKRSKTLILSQIDQKKKHFALVNGVAHR